ncbi:conserved protein of unknown function [Pseudomonas marincola]|uniref:Uncharacterized protein n=1 Tax=Pseudomonas marincola TaxID=437900 RepID=A0A653E8N7_9PSED|nr:hypothetical protein [Pseudomonas marincola]CAE6920294.1 conserved protein of unknown function [Pseudomonas marincola]
MLKFIKTTALGGLLFILPLLLIGLLIEKAIHLLQGPIHKLLPVFEQHAVAGITLFTLAACLVLESHEYWSSVFIPDGGPAGCSAGAVRVMPTSELRITDVPWIKVLACLRHNGAGGLELAKPYLADMQPVAG